MLNKQEKIIWWVWWGVLGDTIGLPFETRTLQRIQATLGQVPGPKSIHYNTHYLDSQREGKVPKRFDGKEYGIISDDTALTLAWLDCIARTQKLELYELMRSHIECFEFAGSRGFGKGAQLIFQNFANTGLLGPDASPSFGNGVLMKQLPYAVFFDQMQTEPHQFDAKMIDIVWLTHNSPIVRLTSLVHNRVLMRLFSQTPETFDVKSLLQRMRKLARYYEENSPFTTEVFDAAGDPNFNIRVSDICTKLITQYNQLQAWKSYSLQQILDTYLPKLQGVKRPGFHVAATFGLVYGLFIQWQSFEDLLKAVEIGEDTDTQAAMIGNMIGLLKGKFYDPALLDSVIDKEHIQGKIDAFLKVLA